jgi:hypothetical protein
VATQTEARHNRPCSGRRNTATTLVLESRERRSSPSCWQCCCHRNYPMWCFPRHLVEPGR